MPYLYTVDRRLPGMYHVWVKARAGLWLFHDDDDRRQFEFLMDRHLGRVVRKDGRGRAYQNFHDRVRLLARNLLSSHLHLILWQRSPDAIEPLMRRVLSAYVRYYNAKYERRGPLIRGRYRSRKISDLKSFKWRIAYVHDNHKRDGLDWEFSTHSRLIEDEPPGWLAAEAVLEKFGGRAAYLAYMDDFQRLRSDDPMTKV